MRKSKQSLESHSSYVQSRCINDLPIQKSSGSVKGLLQIHVSRRWVGRNQTHLGTFYKRAVTQIDMGVRWQFIFKLIANRWVVSFVMLNI